MKRIDIRKTAIAALIAAGTAAGAAAVMADPPAGGYGMGPGMMGGYGPGYHMGPGPGGGYGPGPRGDADDAPRGGYGPGYGMGPGMMGGYGGYGGYGMGPGMMGGYGMGYGMLAQLNLSQDQWNKVEEIQEAARKQNWELMGKMQDESYKLRKLMAASPRDQKAIVAQYQKLSALRLQRFENSLANQDKVDAILTKEQRDQLQQFRGPWAQDQ